MANEIFNAWIKEKGLKKGHVAQTLNVTGPTLSKWLSGATMPQLAHRAAIENLTAGVVKKEDWI